MKKITDIICVCLVLVFLFGVCVLNVAQTDRPTVSEIENRTLAKFPEFSMKSLSDGSFFSGVSLFISDTFIFRDRLVSMSKAIDGFKGIKYTIDGGEDFVVIDPSVNTGEDEGEDISDKINDAINNLGKDTLPQDTDPIDTEPEVTEPEVTEPPVTEPEFVEIPGVNAPGQIQLDNGDIIEVIGLITSEEYEVTALKLSKESLKLTVGSGAVVSASVTTDIKGGAALKWTVSNPDVATIAMNDAGGVSVKVHAVGECVLICEAVNGVYAECKITVAEIYSPSQGGTDEVDFKPNGLFTYAGAAYTQAYYNEVASKNFASTALYYKKLFGDSVRVSTVVAPVSAMVIDSPTVTSRIQNQKVILDKMAAFFDPSVNFVHVYDIMYEHRDEYLFFKSDHHWTGRGAYYAYAAFAKSVGFEPTPLDQFEYEILNENYNGSMYAYTGDPDILEFKDSVEVFYPTKAHTMTITDVKGRTYHYDSSIVAGHRNYLSFISGDHPYTVINVPENPQDRNIIVLKDSFGNAFIPYLCEHYGNIFVVDTRHTSMNVYEQFADYEITDILFVNNIQAASSAAWSQMYLKAVGVNLN